MDSPNETAVLVLAGEIDLHESAQVRQRLEPLLVKKPRRLLIDLSAVSYIDSSGLAVLIEAFQRIQPHGGILALCGLQSAVRDIFEIARLDQVFKIYPDQAKALAG
jgi:anti-sigma B factor antagonist